LAEASRPNIRHDADGELPHESKKSGGPDAEVEEQRRPGLPRQQREYSLPQSPSLPSINNVSNLSPAVISDGSLKAYFLKKINSDFVNDAPLLIEDKLKDLFSNFLSELSGTMETFPGAFLESCVMRLSASIQEIIKAEVIPSLYKNVFKHLNEFHLPPNRNEKLQEFFNDKLDSLQDIIIGLNSENSAGIESVKGTV
jgi:hypothetical protein